MNNTNLQFNNVTIEYPIYNTSNFSLRTQLVHIATGGFIEKKARHVHHVTAIKDASFKLGHGDTVGLVGHNGAGKSTLLRAMAGIYQPTSGTIERNGEVSTLLALSAGIDTELSGYENIIRLSLLNGINLEDAKKHIQDIEEFTQLGNFLQLPMRTYSSGMIARLMFAVATSGAKQILLIDEIFGVGDAGFRTRARERMDKYIRSSGLLVLASHDKELLSMYCNRFLYIEHGIVHEISKNELQND